MQRPDLKNASDDIPTGFQGLLYEPDNEQETVALFLMAMRELKPSWLISRIQRECPDATFYDPDSKKDIRVEFEYLASHFTDHHHDRGKCDLIICWRNDLERAEMKKLGLPIMPLEQALTPPVFKQFCLGRRREEVLDKAVRDNVSKKVRGALMVQRLLQREIPLLRAKYPKLFVDHDLTKHYLLRWRSKGFFGFFPDGKIVKTEVKEACKRFGEKSRSFSEEFVRVALHDVIGFNVADQFSDDELDKRLRNLVKAIDKFCAGLSSLEEENSV